MKTNLLILLIAFLCYSFPALAQISKEAQIKSAVLAAPEDMRAGATVLGFDKDNQLITLREGDGDMICLADDPARTNFSTSCYQKTLEPFMRRGRELRAEGLDRQAVFAQRGKEIAAGTLSIPEGSTLHILYGPDDVLNKETGEVTGAKYRYVVYMPFATTETTGLPLKPSAPGAPWLMDPATHRSHIMITPMN